MPRHYLDDVLDARPGGPRPQQRPLKGPVNAAEDPTGRPPLAIPDGCGGCTWRPDTSSWPATWRRVRTAPHCRIHGNGEQA